VDHTRSLCVSNAERDLKVVTSELSAWASMSV
jgi:hypothetical protein